MTVVGKILVFFNLLFAGITTGFIVVVFVTHQNWYQRSQEELQARQAAETAYLNLQEQAQEEIAKRETAIETLRSDVNQAQQRLQTANAAMQAAKEQSNSEASNFEKERTNFQVAQAELETLRVERDQLKNDKQALQAKITQTITELNQARKESIENQIAAESTRGRNDQLLTANAELRNENRKLKSDMNKLARGESLGTSSVLEEPPPQTPSNLRARVTALDDEGLMVISLGSDAGIKKGAQLSVFRVQPTPAYLGSFTALDVRPKQSVGQFTSENKLKPRINDIVGTLGNR